MKTKRIEVRLSDSEMNALDKAASKSNLSYSELIRRLILNRKIIEAPPVDYYTLICDLRCVGSKLNQILNVAYAEKEIDVPLLQKTIRDYHETEKMIWKSFSPDRI